MCGIVGIFNQDRKPVRKQTIDAMTQAIAHRGPDSSGRFVKAHVGLGHRRLSILDLSDAGHQPMTYQDSGFWIVYNGEVYNYIELRTILEKKGYVFQSSSDTEVVLASYIEWGDRAFEKFNGMWALAIYNENTHDLLLCRDRYGIKPLYYYIHSNTVAFASEYKSFWAAKDCLNIDFDKRGVATALINPFELEASTHSLLNHVFNLLPGSLLKVTLNRVKTHTWWRTTDHIEKLHGDENDHAEQFKALFADAIRLRMRSDVGVGTSLSGGLDSSAIVAMLSAFGHQNHGAFIHSFKGSPIDETDYAKRVAEKTNTPAYYIQMEKKDLLQHVDEILFSFESISSGMADSPYRIYQAQRRNGVTVTLDGHGADEMLGGYDWYVDEMVKDIPIFSNPARFAELYRLKNDMTRNPQVRGTQYMARFVFRSIPFIAPVRGFFNQALVRHGLNRRFLLFQEEPYDATFHELPLAWSNLQKRLYLDFHSMILPRILKNFDLMSMAHGVEVRMPFLDYRLVNFVFSLPDQEKIGNGYTKRILRNALDGILEDRIRLRKRKIGFNSPMSGWLLHELRPWVEDILQPNQHHFDIIDKKALKTFYSGCIQAGKLSWSNAMTLWKYLSALRLSEMIKDRF